MFQEVSIPRRFTSLALTPEKIRRLTAEKKMCEKLNHDIHNISRSVVTEISFMNYSVIYTVISINYTFSGCISSGIIKFQLTLFKLKV